MSAASPELPAAPRGSRAGRSCSASRPRATTPRSRCSRTARTLRSHLIAAQDVHRLYGGVVPELASRAHLELLPRWSRAALEEAERRRRRAHRDRGDARARAGRLAGRGRGVREGVRAGARHPGGRRQPHRGAPARRHARARREPVAGGRAGGLGRPHRAGRGRAASATTAGSAARATTRRARPTTRSRSCSASGFPGGPAIDRLGARGPTRTRSIFRGRCSTGRARLLVLGAQDRGRARARAARRAALSAARWCADVAASFQAAVVDTLVRRSAARRSTDDRRARAHAWAAAWRATASCARRLGAECAARGVALRIPSPRLCADNAAMIALVGAWMLERRRGIRPRARRRRLARGLGPADPLARAGRRRAAAQRAVPGRVRRDSPGSRPPRRGVARLPTSRSPARSPIGRLADADGVRHAAGRPARVPALRSRRRVRRGGPASAPGRSQGVAQAAHPDRRRRAQPARGPALPARERGLSTCSRREDGAAGARAWPPRRCPTCVLLDVMMPQLDGYEVCRRLRASFATRHIPIIMLTAQGRARTTSCRASRAAPTTTSPSRGTARELMLRVRNALEWSRQQRSASPLTGLPGNLSINDEITRRLQQPVRRSRCSRSTSTTSRRSTTTTATRAATRRSRPLARHPGRDRAASTAAAGLRRPHRRRRLRGAHRARARRGAGRGDHRRVQRRACRELYDPEDRERGYVEVRNRRHEPERFPLMSLTIALVSTDRMPVSHLAAAHRHRAGAEGPRQGHPGQRAGRRAPARAPAPPKPNATSPERRVGRMDAAPAASARPPELLAGEALGAAGAGAAGAAQHRRPGHRVRDRAARARCGAGGRRLPPAAGRPAQRRAALPRGLGRRDALPGRSPAARSSG